MKSLITRWLAMALVLAAPSVLAHDPGISSLNLCAEGRDLSVQWHLNPADLEWLTADSQWIDQAPGLIQLSSALSPLSATMFSAHRAAADGWKLSWLFRVPADFADGTLAATALDRFRFGHRVHASVCAGSDVGAQDGLLSETYPDWSLRAGGSAIAGLAWFESALMSAGVIHILTGFDHLLFLLLLLVAAVSLRQAVILVTLFSLAHSLTLGLGALGWLSLPSQPVEVAIAASIVITALLNLSRRGPRGIHALTFGFGLIHGLGFAGFTSDLLAGAAPAEQIKMLANVNLGIEAGQVAIVLAVVPLVAWLRRLGLERAGKLVSSGVAGTVGCLWMVERVLG